jgi:hypothetical protein
LIKLGAVSALSMAGEGTDMAAIGFQPTAAAFNGTRIASAELELVATQAGLRL